MLTVEELDRMDDLSGSVLLSAEVKRIPFLPQEEQATYIEWLNSAYQNEIAPFRADSAKTCQGCHMPQDFRGNRLRYRVALIEDPTYPMADHRARDSAITVAVRDTFSRHMLMGINLFTLGMFQQFPDLGGERHAEVLGAVVRFPGPFVGEAANRVLEGRHSGRLIRH